MTALTAMPGWIARTADGGLDFNGFRFARLVDDVWHYAGPAFTAGDEAATLTAIERNQP